MNAEDGPSEVGGPEIGAGGGWVTETVAVVVLGGFGGSWVVTVTGGGAGLVTVTVTGTAGGEVDVTDGVVFEESAGRGVLPATSSAETSRPIANPASPVTTTAPQVGTVFDTRHLPRRAKCRYED
ncbi:hypothetical protein SAMN04489732_113252 [Amycolatopsis saalfeldensis]|uniref:Uncharacterized protein n=1 Tax=Amycolatopsis saalfeldensis TaxID=394193 RepID=A0A1H8YCQ6_9PSEU|nr:hypothetical protein SAMN04489732_113252 [Amycolatopsis saalfeldensis]